ncbi:MAG TPA: hypothetical protein VMX54_07105 [Vicinamibacteria bacterium]|nr:hypothetical protein [Vicinamibacteria bacterium]
MSRAGPALTLAVLGALVLVTAAQYGPVRWTNFGGADEWLLLDLNGRGIVAMPHANRPLNLLWSLPGPLLTPYRFEGYRLAYLGYLAATGFLTWLLARRLAPEQPVAAFTAGALAIGWAPLDMARLSIVQMLPNLAVTACWLACLLLLLRLRDDGRPVWFVAAVLLATLAARSYEAVLGLLLGAPPVVWLSAPGSRRPRRLGWLVAWEAAVAILAALAAWPLVHGDGSSLYQSAVVRADFDPLRYLSGLARQYWYHLAPLVPRDPSELTPAVLVPAAAFLAGAALVLCGRGTGASGGRRGLLLLAGVGLVLAGMGYSVLLLGASVQGPSRMQFLAAPGIALFLAMAIGLAASFLPGPRLGVALALALGATVVAVGAGHTRGMQREWDRTTFYPRQRDCLAALVRQAPALRAGSLLLLIDEDGTWPFAFTFRHAGRLVYGDGVTAHALGSRQLLYSATADAAGIRVSPWRIVQGPWHERPTEHRYDQVVVFRLSGGALSRLDTWPQTQLGALPAGARYAPAESITDAPAPPGRRVLD